MNNNIKELTEGMQRLCAIANRIVSHQGEVSLIEKDMLLEDLRRLYDVALRLRDEEVSNNEPRNKAVKADDVEMPDEEMLSSTVMATMAAMGVAERSEKEEVKKETTPEPEPKPEPEPEPTPEPEPVQETPAAEMPKMEDLELTENSLLFDEVILEHEEKETPTAEQKPLPSYLEPELEPAADEEPAAPAEPPVEEAEVIDEVKAKLAETPKAGTQASLLDYLKRPVEEKPTVRTLGDTLGGTENGERRVESVLNQKVSDLRTVININDKFSFMSELFHNNMKAYNDFILRLNSIDTRDEALLCVNEVSAQYKWDENSLAVQAFYKVFDKKF